MMEKEIERYKKRKIIRIGESFNDEKERERMKQIYEIRMK